MVDVEDKYWIAPSFALYIAVKRQSGFIFLMPREFWCLYVLCYSWNVDIYTCVSVATRTMDKKVAKLVGLQSQYW